MTSTSREALVVFAENVENVNKAVDNMNSSLARHTDLLNASEEMKFKIEELSNAINSNDKKLMVNLSKKYRIYQMDYLNLLKMKRINLENPFKSLVL